MRERIPDHIGRERGRMGIAEHENGPAWERGDNDNDTEVERGIPMKCPGEVSVCFLAFGCAGGLLLCLWAPLPSVIPASFTPEIDLTQELLSVPLEDIPSFPQIFDSTTTTFLKSHWSVFNGRFYFDESSKTISALHYNEIDRFLGYNTESWALFRYGIPWDVHITVDAQMIEILDPKGCQSNLIALLIGSIVWDLFPADLGVVRWFPDLSWKPLHYFSDSGHGFRQTHVEITRRADELSASVDQQGEYKVQLDQEDMNSPFRQLFAIGNRCSKVFFSNITVQAI